MKKLLAAACTLGLLLSACSAPAASQPEDDGKLHILATTYPVYLFTTAVTEGAEYTDDCQLYERLGKPIRLVPGDYENIKITTREDLDIAEAVLERRVEELLR